MKIINTRKCGSWSFFIWWEYIVYGIKIFIHVTVRSNIITISLYYKTLIKTLNFFYFKTHSIIEYLWWSGEWGTSICLYLSFFPYESMLKVFCLDLYEVCLYFVSNMYGLENFISVKNMEQYGRFVLFNKKNYYKM